MADPLTVRDGRRELVSLCTGLITTVVGVWVMTKLMRTAMDPPPAGASRNKTRLGRMLGVNPRTLRLNSFELQLASKLLDASDIDVTMEDVAGLDEIVSKLQAEQAFVNSFPGASSSSVLSASKGVLLHGPPGTGKTMVAKAFAKTSNAVLINVTASALFSKWVGESNKLTNAVFALARIIGNHGRTTIIFLDEVDAILGDGGQDSEHVIQVKTEFMQLWDGIQATKNVIVVGATNRPDRLNDAIWRRFSTQLKVPLPDEDARCAILCKKMQRMSSDLALSAAQSQVDPNATVLHVPKAWLQVTPDPDCATTVAPTDLQGAASLEKRVTAAGLSKILSTPMHPLRRAAKLTYGYNGSDLFEAIKLSARHAWRNASTRSVIIAESDLLYSISEVQAAAITRRANETRSTGLPSRAQPAHGGVDSVVQLSALLEALARTNAGANAPGNSNGNSAA